MSAGEQRSKGNIQNLMSALTGSNLNEKKNAMKTIISAMTCGEDVSMFFTAVRLSDQDHSEHGNS
jgi:vesicle coat complex subunit